MKRVLLAIALILPTIYAMGQVGIGTERPKATLDVTAVNPVGNQENVEGVLIPRVDRERAQSMKGIEISTTIYVNDIQTGTQTGTAVNINSVGFYYFDGSVWVKLATGNNNSGFFYMPSIVLPTVPTDKRVEDTTNLSYTYDNVSSFYTIKLHDLYESQFKTDISSTTKNGLAEFILPADSYEYFVTYADKTVFTDIEVDDNGVLIYKVSPNSIIRNGSFMNIVLKIK